MQEEFVNEMIRIYAPFACLLISSLCLLLSSCTSKKPPPSETVPVEVIPESPPVDTVTPNSVPPSSSNTNSKPKTQNAKLSPNISQYAHLSGGYEATCDGQTTDLAGTLMAIAKMMESQKIKYSSADTADCSGIFHRVLWELKVECPEQAYPAFNRYRDSRSLALWYHKHKQLFLVHDPLALAEMIRPGAVMFYGNEGDDYSDATVDELMIQGKGIKHLGIVVKVKKDKKGRVTQYFLFHGRNRKHPAGITSFHRRKPSRKKYPILGDGPNPWVAIAPIVFGK